MQNLKYDREFFRDFWRLFKPYWRSEEKWHARLLAGLIILFTIGQVEMTVEFNEFYRVFFDALQNFDKATLIHLIWRFIILATLSILIFGYNIYFSGLLTIRWRRWLTQHFINYWLNKHNFYRLALFNKNIDNPDQRISEDLDSFPTVTLSLFTTVLSSLLTIASFGIILWHMSGSLTIPLPLNSIHHLVIPGYLLWGALIYAALGTWITRAIGRTLAGYNYQQQAYNADLRFGLIRVREASEQIALYRGETSEITQLQQTFKHIFSNFISIVKVQKKLMFFENGYYASSYLFGLLIGLPLYFAKKIQIGGITQISGAFNNLITALSVLIISFTTIANWRAIIFRLTEFTHSLQQVASIANNQQSTGITISYQPDSPLNVKNLTLTLGDQTPLLQKINLCIAPGSSVWLLGPAGIGKSTLLKALAGIWPYGSGEIVIPAHSKMLFLPQKPYLPLGTLRNILMYPKFQGEVSDRHLNELLSRCGLTKLLGALDKTANWAHELSLGEQQLIAFARVFLQQPDWVFLDEATSALDESNEAKMYQALKQYLPQLTIVSIGHRPSLAKYHAQTIDLTQVSIQ